VAVSTRKARLFLSGPQAMAHDLIRLMHSLFLPAARSCCDTRWCPPADVYQTAGGWLVKLDLAGVRPEDLHVNLRGRRLTVQGIRRDWAVEDVQSHYRMEITYSRFERTIELPAELGGAGLAIDYRDGMLLVRIQTEEGQP
jgi:HSP20 family protein